MGAIKKGIQGANKRTEKRNKFKSLRAKIRPILKTIISTK